MSSTPGRTVLGRVEQPSQTVEEILAVQSSTFAEVSAYDQAPKAVLFTDIVGSTAYFEKNGDEAGMAMIELHNSLLFPEVTSAGGRVIKTIGDAIMACFDTPDAAVKAAVSMQERLKAHNTGEGAADPIQVRIGVNYGLVIVHGDDLFGDVVNAAARVEALARGQQVLISAAVEERLGQAFEIPRSPYDAFAVKGKEAPLEVFEVCWDPDAGSFDDKPRLLPKGHVLGRRFEILGVVGEGGMGVVYRAKDHDLDEDVALKFLHPSLASEQDVIQRFKREVKLARAITHPNICRIHEFLKTDGHIFLSMELLKGETLEEILENGPVGVDLFEEVVCGICEGLAAAHEKGIVHRDLKPANVLIEEGTDRVVLMDFGIARGGGVRSNTVYGMVVGTPEYMSPEQVSGEQAGPASDIYSLGVMMYQMLSGTVPFTDDSPVAAAARHVTDDPPPLAERAPGAPAHLVHIVHRCLAKVPAARYANVGELLRAVRNDTAFDMPAASDTLDSPMVWDEEPAPTTVTPPSEAGLDYDPTADATEVRPADAQLDEEPMDFDDAATEVVPPDQLSAVHRSVDRALGRSGNRGTAAPPPRPAVEARGGMARVERESPQAPAAEQPRPPSVIVEAAEDPPPKSRWWIWALVGVLVFCLIIGLSLLIFSPPTPRSASPKAAPAAQTKQAGRVDPTVPRPLKPKKSGGAKRNSNSEGVSGLAYLTVKAPARVALTLDGEVVKGRLTRKLLKPGLHRIIAKTRKGKVLFDRLVEIDAGAHKVVEVPAR